MRYGWRWSYIMQNRGFLKTNIPKQTTIPKQIVIRTYLIQTITIFIG